MTGSVRTGCMYTAGSANSGKPVQVNVSVCLTIKKVQAQPHYWNRVRASQEQENDILTMQFDLQKE